jgi:hypothetical protein
LGLIDQIASIESIDPLPPVTKLNPDIRSSSLVEGLILELRVLQIAWSSVLKRYNQNMVNAQISAALSFSLLMFAQY